MELNMYMRKAELRLLAVLTAVLTLLYCDTLVSAAAEADSGQIYLAVAETRAVWIDDKDPKADYRYTSSNKKVVSVTDQGVMKARKAGTAKIVVKQRMDKKTVKISTFTVHVKKAYLSESNGNDTVCILTSQPGYYRYLYDSLENNAYTLKYDLWYQNPKAEYTCYSCDETKLVLDDEAGVVDTRGTGRVEVILKETYEKKTRTVGSFFVEIKDPYLLHAGSTVELLPEEPFSMYAYTKNMYRYMVKMTGSPNTPAIDQVQPSDREKSQGEDGVRTFEGDMDEAVRCAMDPGTYYVHTFLYDYTQQKYTVYLGAVQINVRLFQLDFDRNPSWYEKDRYNLQDGFQMQADQSAEIPVYFNPEYTDETDMKEVTVSSSDESVIKVRFDRTYQNYQLELKAAKLLLTACKPGTALITVKSGSGERAFQVTAAPASYHTGSRYNIRSYLTQDGFIRKKDVTVTSSDPSIAEMEVLWINDPAFEHSDLKDAGFRITTKSASGPVTLTASCNGEIIYSITIQVQD